MQSVGIYDRYRWNEKLNNIKFYLVIRFPFMDGMLEHYSKLKYMLKFNNKNNGKRCKICSKLTTKAPKWWH